MRPLRELLREAREAAGLTQAELAARVAERTGRGAAGTRAMVAAYESGAREPREAIAEAVLDVLGLEIALIPRTSKKKKISAA